ncbi:recombinase family protein [Candidatus Nitrotoga sp. AM1P]|uniref:recombinase family protein n=1 Tax=Candidatus Nitrotoga sp. AM1P TaxID=2559597 RepID=UPI0010B6C24D|nr:recombinase family protein [Candidatus Nitrotoga sp. AM1P]BBJ23045.1 resolvase [Candidatus Nitrotoga sp. AM1P]
MKIGYARVSTEDQNLDLQLDLLSQDGCQKIFKEKMTGKRGSRPVLDKALATLKNGDMLVVWKLDRLGRSLRNLTNILNDLEGRGIGFRSISDGIDTETPAGRLLFHLIGAIAEFECSQISERTKAGLHAARRRGRRLGRPPRIGHHDVKLAKHLRDTQKLNYADIAARLGVGRTTLWRAMAEDAEP